MEPREYGLQTADKTSYGSDRSCRPVLSAVDAPASLALATARKGANPPFLQAIRATGPLATDMNQGGGRRDVAG